MCLLLLCESQAFALSGGVADKDDRYPFVVEVLFRRHFICSGTVLYPRIVVTAAHCVARVIDARSRLFANDTWPQPQFTVATSIQGKTEVYPSSEILLPPAWRQVAGEPDALGRYAYDLALIVTKDPIEVPLPASLPALATDWQRVTGSAVPPALDEALLKAAGKSGVMVGFGADNCSADQRCGHWGTRRYRSVELKDTVGCFDDELDERVPGATLEPAIAAALPLAVWCTDWGAMPGDSGGALLVQGPEGKLYFAGVIASHWGSYARQVVKQEADKRSFATGLYPTFGFIEDEARKLGYAP